MGIARRTSRRARLCLRDHSGEYRQKSAGDLLLLAYGHLARLHRQGRQAADRAQLSRRRHRAARGCYAGDPVRRSSGVGRPDRQRHHHDRWHHAVGRRQQGRPRRDHGCGAIPAPQPADQARHDQDPVHARRGDRPRRRQGGSEKARRRLRLHDGRRNRGEYRGRDVFGRRRHHHHRRRLHPSRLCQGQDGARDQNRIRHRRSPAKGYLLAGNHRGQGRLSASDRHQGALEKATLSFIVRDFNDDGLRKRKRCWKASSRT